MPRSRHHVKVQILFRHVLDAEDAAGKPSILLNFSIRSMFCTSVENHLYMNVDYVSRKFVRVTGQKFSAFLTDVRIRYAKKLLSEYGTEQIHVIAEQVGCGNNPHYFSQIFKKSTGLTPSAYAKMTHAAQTSAEEADKPAP